MPLRAFFDAGIMVAGSSDAPVTELDVLSGIAACVRHPIGSQRLTLREALLMYTRHAAELCGLDARKGSIEVGKDADFVVLRGKLLRDPARMSIEKVFVRGVRMR
jgi:hypothetical protein